MSRLFSVDLWLGFAAGLGMALLWAVLWYGPQMRTAGASAERMRLTNDTIKAARDFIDAADRSDFAFTVCDAAGGVYDFVRGECKQGAAK